MAWPHLVLLLLLVLSCDAKKKSKKPPADGPITPEGLHPDVYCETCKAVIEQLTAKTRKWRKSPRLESEVMNAMDTLCTKDTLGDKYKFSAPTLVKACEAMLAEHEEDLEELYSRNKVKGKDKFNHWCNGQIKACRGIDVAKIEANPDLNVQEDPTGGMGGMPGMEGMDMDAMANMMGGGDDEAPPSEDDAEGDAEGDPAAAEAEDASDAKAGDL
jgi:hypothetical protein|eukprot:CAMPEP_0174286298 /NCGR_PEP_ID=MMETSP0809-20121228/11302_1 /TAXON_ID=73025 ORGANISM="Eutreptiella gymnastica-like, Strain CCMP1594" /NCGR_SAMPLE_ID=MMETSP0809 /ASSEMBLY_ACC=CAM_ASM_000658 /LENGTH=214 /DNA_ID=CAMNT_0015382315 /DNA_START=43 /DNA_END=687 /DNA_ORIENTATION=+